jgi:uncharacterized protein
MKNKSITIRVNDVIGKVSGKLTIPDNPVCVISLAHGAGADMNHPFMTSLAQSLALKGTIVLRFNFPFTEHKKVRPDSPSVAQKTIEAAMIKAHKLFPSLPLFLAGKSFGGRMSSLFISEHSETWVRGIIFYGFPLHAVGKPSTERADHLKKIKVPMLFLQGTRDSLASFELIQSVCFKLHKTKLVKIQNADHSFKAGKTNTIEILTNETVKWIDKLK